MPRSSKFVFRFLPQLVELAEQLGAQQAPLLASVGLTPDDVTPEVSISRKLVEALLAEAGRKTSRPSFGLDLARTVARGSLGWLEYAVTGCPTVDAGFALLARYSTLLNQSPGFSYARHDRECELHYEATDRESIGPQLSEFATGLVLLHTRALLGSPFSPSRAWFPHAAPTSHVVSETFGREVTFGATTSGFAITTADAARAVPSHDPKLHALLIARLDEILPAAAGTVSATAKARVEILARLGRRSLELADVAAAIRTSPRTLQRNLAREGRTLASLVDDARRSRAGVLLARNDLTVSRIAELLGFACASGFERAHRRWTGVTPFERRVAKAASRQTPERSSDGRTLSLELAAGS